jgi:peptidoglycan/xylan/chitin deacetylase (PgdA/CDA1 family)
MPAGFKPILRAILGRIITNSGLVRAFRRYHKDQVIILNFHRVDREPDLFDMAVDPETFQQYLNYLRQYYHIESLANYVDQLKSGRSTLPYTVILTFDDGYAGIYQNVFPLLSANHIPATVFLVGSWIDNGSAAWWDRIENIFRQKMGGVETKAGGFSEKAWQMECLDFVRAVTCLPAAERDREIKRLEKTGPPSISPADPVKIMSTEMIAEMTQHRIELGNHTYSHAALIGETPDQQRQELEKCEKILDTFQPRSFKAFAYPYGFACQENSNIKSLLKEMAFDCALTNVFGFNERSRNLYRLKRYSPADEPLGVFAAELSGAFEMFRSLGALFPAGAKNLPLADVCASCRHAARC